MITIVEFGMVDFKSSLYLQVVCTLSFAISSVLQLIACSVAVGGMPQSSASQSTSAACGS